MSLGLAPTMPLIFCSSESTIDGTWSMNWEVSSTSDGITSARTPARRPSATTSASKAPIGLGMPMRSSREAAVESAIAIKTVIRIATSSVISWRNSRPATTSAKASSTARIGSGRWRVGGTQ